MILNFIISKTFISENDRYKFTDYFRAGHFKRVFVAVPANSTSARIMIRNNHPTEVAKYVLHTQQLPAQKRFSDHDFFKYFSIAPVSDTRYNVDVIGSMTMEICFGKWWSCSVDTETTVELEFDRINLVSGYRTGIIASNCITRVEVRNDGQQAVKINPSLKLKTFIHSIKPIDAKIRPLGCRDIWPDAKVIYEIVLNYTLKLVS